MLLPSIFKWKFWAFNEKEERSIIYMRRNLFNVKLLSGKNNAKKPEKIYDALFGDNTFEN